MDLPSWEQMSDLDKGAALLYLHTAKWKDPQYVREHAPPRYVHPALAALDSHAACVHAASLFEGDLDVADRALGLVEVDRLIRLARDHRPKPCSPEALAAMNACLRTPDQTQPCGFHHATGRRLSAGFACCCGRYWATRFSECHYGAKAGDPVEAPPRQT